MKIRTIKNTAMLVVFSFASVILFAAIGGKDKKANKSNNNLSNLVSTKISLRSGYEFKGNKLISLNTKKEFVSMDSYTTIEKGNKTIIVQNKPFISKDIISVQGNNQGVQLKVKMNLN